jgi:hypothetical protein
MANTGDVNMVSGVYECADCGKQILVAKGRTFPLCVVCVKSTAYNLLTPTDSGRNRQHRAWSLLETRPICPGLALFPDRTRDKLAGDSPGRAISASDSPSAADRRNISR